MSLGFSITELLEALKKCQDVYQAFASKFGDAARQFSAFKDELDRVEQALKVQDQINRWTGQVYPGTIAFREALDDSRHLAEKQRRIIEQSRGSGRSESLIGILQTAQRTFDKELPRLQDRLSYNRIELVSFNVTLVLHNSFNGADSSFATTGAWKSDSESGLPDDKSQQIEHVLVKLFRIGSVYGRMSNTAVQAPVSPISRPAHLDAEFESCIASLCALVGLPASRLAAVPVDDIAGYLSEDWWQSVVQSSSQISHYSNSAPVEPHTARTCQVKVKIEGSGFIAHSYVIFKRCCFWRNGQGLVVLEHKLAPSTRKCYPYTQHRIFNTPLTLSFLELQDVVIKPSNDRKLSCKPQYTFATEHDYALFQSDVRGGRELLHEFHASSIGSKNSRGGADAYNEVVKIWNAPPGSVDRTISFPAALSSSSTRDFEMPLKWFTAPVTPLRSAIVRLELASNFSHSSSGSKTSSLKSKLMRREPVSAASIASSAGSIRSVNTNLATDAYAPAEYITRVGYLDFKFACPTAIPAFLAAIAEPFAPATPSTFASIPPSLYSGSSPSTISTSWSGSPFSFRSASRRPVLNRTSTIGTGQESPTGMLQLPGAAMDKAVPVMERSADEFALPAAEASLSGLVIRSDEQMEPPVTVPQTPSSLLRDPRTSTGTSGGGKNGFW